MINIPTYFASTEIETIKEVIQGHELLPEEEEEVWRRITEICKKTTGRFYAYATAHSICSDVVRELKK